MARVSNFLINLTNAVFTAVGLAAIAFAVYIFIHGGGHIKCHRLIQNPILISGTIIFAISALGLIGTCYKNNAIMITYLVLVFLSIVVLVGFALFVLFVTNEAVGNAVSGKGIKGAKTGDFENWLENRFVNGRRWRRLRACLAESRVCRSLGDLKGGGFYKKNFSPIQSGCCKPPSECGFESKNATWWTPPKSGGNVASATNKDCGTWSNAQNQLCFRCESCKAGVVANVRKEWKPFLIINACAVALVIIVFSLGCCARRNVRTPWKRRFW